MTEGKNVPHSSADVPFRRMSCRKQSLNIQGLVGVIDEGTKTVSFSVYTTPEFKEILSHKVDLTMITPQEGWYEQDPMEMMESIYTCCDKVCAELPDHGFKVEDIATIGITNQRETTIMWDSETGKPLYNALVWKDTRTATTVDSIMAKIRDNNWNYFKECTGLPVSTYFSALKIRWLKDNVPAVKKACRERRCKAGTVDSWIVWNLTQGALHITDVTNASRTMLMNIETLHWDPMLLKAFSINRDLLPEIRSCSEVYGKISNDRLKLKGIPISGIVGNQQASLLGQMCLKPGQTKNTYRSGCFMLCNTGEKRIISRHGLLTTVAYKLGPEGKTHYALEGAVAVAGHALAWLENRVRILPDSKDAEQFAETVANSGDVYFVPAFTGLYAPYWKTSARGIIIGLTQYSTKHHIVRAALEAICFQSLDIIECMRQECGFAINKIYADGKLSSNSLLMQIQADTGGVPVFRSQLLDTTAFGAAMCAAHADGINLCRFEPEKRYYENVFYDTFLPTYTDEERNLRYGKWKRAVERCLGWASKQKSKVNAEENQRLLATLPASMFILGSFAMLVHSLRGSLKAF